MSDTPNSPGPPKELSTEIRLLIAFALMGVVLFATPYFFKMISPPPAKTSVATQKTAPPAVSPAAPAVSAPAEAEETPATAAEQTAAKKEEQFVVETDLYKVVFSNRGAVVKQWILKRYTDENGKPLELVNPAAESKAGSPFTLIFEQRKPGVDLNTALFAAKPADDGLGVTYEFSDGTVVARKTFHFQKSQYVAQVSTEVSEKGAPLPHLIAWRGGFGDPAAVNPAAQHTIYFDLNDSKLVTHDAKSAKNGTVTSEGNFSFAGIEDTYFTAVFLPASAGSLKVLTFSDTMASAADPKEQPRVGAGIGGSGRNLFSAFVGPKDHRHSAQGESQARQHRRFRLVLHSWPSRCSWSCTGSTTAAFTTTAGPSSWSPSLINFLLFPLKLTSLKSMKKMQALQPQIATINEKYKGIGMRDPRKAAAERGDHGAIQEARRQSHGRLRPHGYPDPVLHRFLSRCSRSPSRCAARPGSGSPDLSQPEHLAIRILPIIMVATSS